MRSRDTEPEARAVQLAVYRRMTRAERLALALAMSEDMRAIAATGAAWRAQPTRARQGR